MALVLPILITAGVGYGVYHAFFRVPELRALLFEGGRVARGAVLPLPDGAVVLSQENARPVADVLRAGARPAAAARVYLTRVGLASSDKPRWDLALDGVTGPDAGNARLWADGDRVFLAAGERLEARALATGALAWTAAMKRAGMRRGPLVVRPADHRGEFFRVLQQTDRSQTAVMTVAPGQDAGPEETHAADQILYVIEGEAEVRMGAEVAAAGPGTLVTIPAGTPHHVRSAGAVPLFFVTVYAPPAY
jgi:mannose-6-phosphate isomerase-like protein (cupin superfamily)